MRTLRTLTATTMALTLLALASPAFAVTTIYQSSFEGTDGGWVASADWGNLTGDWERGAPATPPIPNDRPDGLGPNGAFDGNEVWGTLLDEGYTNAGGRSFLRQTFDLSAYSSATMSWHQYVYVFYNFDRAELYVNGDLLYERTSNTGTPDWEFQSVDLTPYAGGLANVSFELLASTVVNAPGYYIDSVLIEGEQAPTTSAIPEPATAGLLGLAAMGLLARRRRAAAY